MLAFILATATDSTLSVDAGQIQQLAGHFGIDTPFIVAQMLNFALVAFLLYRFAFKPVLATIEERQQKIADGLQYAEEMKAKLAEAEKLYADRIKDASHEGQKILEEARESARAFYETQTQQAARHAEEMIKKAEQAIAMEHERMLQDLKRQVAQLVVQTTERVLAKNLTDADKQTFNRSASEALSEVA
ncbi:MAG: ATP synthase F0 subunit B [Verrucomicrobia bacterium 21-51-4]|nr:MAG: ATP synthase F0 subunit B [Verrucomicrobia bacterium 21-51-4]HQU08696.1 F0F1 ATP synthase subunit B [Opitutales bacterium]